MSNQKRASFDELLEFANKVRKAGGGNPLDALMPAVPQSAKQCLIAKNLNFNCEVDTLVETQHAGDWVMKLEDTEIADKIATALDLERLDLDIDDYDYDDEYDLNHLVILPPEIGQVAADFDHWSDSFVTEIANDDNGNPVLDTERGYGYKYQFKLVEGMLDQFNEFRPYIDASCVEAMKIGVLDENGNLIL